MLNFFQNDLAFYEREFGREYEPRNTENGELVFLWHNGMGPIKDEVSFNFIAIPGQAGYVIFENEELGISFPFYIGDDKQKRDDLLALRVVRVAFPKYLARPTYYNDAHLVVNGQKLPLEKVENINDIAFKTLKDRFLRDGYWQIIVIPYAILISLALVLLLLLDHCHILDHQWHQIK